MLGIDVGLASVSSWAVGDFIGPTVATPPDLIVTREGVGDDFFGAGGLGLASARRLSQVPVGAAATGRRIYVGLSAVGSGGTISGVTIDGQPMSLSDLGESMGEFGSAHSGFWTIDSDLIGGSVDLIVNGSLLREVAAQVWSSVGHRALSASVSAANGTSVGSTINTFAGGALLGVGQTLNAQPVTWSPAPGFVDQEIRSTDHFTAFEDLNTATATGAAYSFSTPQSNQKAISIIAIS